MKCIVFLPFFEEALTAHIIAKYEFPGEEVALVEKIDQYYEKIIFLNMQLDKFECMFTDLRTLVNKHNISTTFINLYLRTPYKVDKFASIYYNHYGVSYLQDFLTDEIIMNTLNKYNDSFVRSVLSNTYIKSIFSCNINNNIVTFNMPWDILRHYQSYLQQCKKLQPFEWFMIKVSDKYYASTMINAPDNFELVNEKYSIYKRVSKC